MDWMRQKSANATKDRRKLTNQRTGNYFCIGLLFVQVPVTDETGQNLVTDEYIKFIVTKANNKLTENLKRIEKFEFALMEEISDKPNCDIIEDNCSKSTKPVYRRKNKRVKEVAQSEIQKDYDALDDFSFPEG